MEVFNGNRTFEFIPDSDEYAGKLYFFKIILKEEGSNALGNQFTFQVFIDSLESEDENEILKAFAATRDEIKAYCKTFVKTYLLD